MNLGERIYQLRTQKNLSQGDLADMLDVSRQSVSKWETNSSVPDLDRLIKLSAVFDVTLDELVKGEKTYAEVSPFQQAIPVQASAPLPGRKIAGILLFCMAFFSLLLLSIFGDFLSGLVLAAPFVLCGAICFIFQRHAGLWCAWALTFLLDIYLTFATSSNWRSLFVYLRGYIPFTISTIISLLHLLIMVVMVVVTVLRFRKGPFSASRRNAIRLLSGLLLLILSVIGEYALLQWLFALAETTANFSLFISFISLCSLLINWAQYVLVLLLLIYTLRFLHTKKA